VLSDSELDGAKDMATFETPSRDLSLIATVDESGVEAGIREH